MTEFIWFVWNFIPAVFIMFTPIDKNTCHGRCNLVKPPMQAQYYNSEYKQKDNIEVNKSNNN